MHWRADRWREVNTIKTELWPWAQSRPMAHPLWPLLLYLACEPLCACPAPGSGDRPLQGCLRDEGTAHLPEGPFILCSCQSADARQSQVPFCASEAPPALPVTGQRGTRRRSDSPFSRQHPLSRRVLNVRLSAAPAIPLYVFPKQPKSPAGRHYSPSTNDI